MNGDKNEKQKSIAIIVPYIGKIPPYFNLWLKSALHNPSIDFFLLLDDKEFDETKVQGTNIKVYWTTLKEIKDRMQKYFDFPIVLEKAYKLCDYKPAYGEAFYDLIKDYDYWGHCDIDLVLGNLRHFLTENLLGDEYARIFTKGFFSIYKNDKEINSLYRTLSTRKYNSFRRVYSSSSSFCFDEYGEHLGGGLSCIFKENDIRMYDSLCYADINFMKRNFHINDLNGMPMNKNIIFSYENGNLYSNIVVKNEGIKKKEYILAHFQKRSLQINKLDELGDMFAIVPPGKIVKFKPIDRLMMIRYNFHIFPYKQMIMFRVKQIKNFKSTGLYRKLFKCSK